MAMSGVDDRTRWGTRVAGWVEVARPYVGVLVIALWLVWAVVAWRVEPRSVDAAQVRADIASGQILTYRVTGQEHPQDAWLPPTTGDGWDTLGLDEATGLPRNDFGGQSATGILYWVEGSWGQARHYAQNTNGTAYETLVTEMRRGGVPLERPDAFEVLPYQDAPFWPGWAALVLGLGAVLVRYRPTRVNRWGWFWLVAMVPFGLGLVACAVGELIRPAAARPVELTDDGKPREQRLRGGRALLLSLVLIVVISFAAGQISQNTTSLWIP